MRIGSTPRVHLIHVVAESTTWQGTSTTYAHQLIPVSRPAHGQVRAAVPCGRCGLSIDLRLRSVRGTVWRRRGWLLVMSLAWLAFPAPLVAWQVAPEVMATLSAGQALGLIGGAVLVFFLGFFAWIRYLIEDGVRVSEDGVRWRVQRSGHHGLRRPGY